MLSSNIIFFTFSSALPNVYGSNGHRQHFRGFQFSWIRFRACALTILMGLTILMLHWLRSQIKKTFRMPSGKRRVHSVNGRHHDHRWRNASDVFWKAYLAFYNLRFLPSTHGNCRSEYRHRTKCFKVQYTPFTLNLLVESWISKPSERRTLMEMSNRDIKAGCCLMLKDCNAKKFL